MPFSCLIIMQYLEAQHMMGLVWMGYFIFWFVSISALCILLYFVVMVFNYMY